MIYFNNNRTPLPEELDVEAALACASDYWTYHRMISTEITNTLSEDDFENLKQKAQETLISLRKLGLCINAEYVAEVRQKHHKRVAKSKLRSVVLLLGLGVCAALPLLLTVQLGSVPAVGLLVYYFYCEHIAAVNLSKAETKLGDRFRESRHAELDLEAVCHSYNAWNAHELATIRLYLEDPYAQWVHPGQIDPNRRPEKQRPVPPLTSEDYIYRYGANFENAEDPRIPKSPDQLIFVKLLLASLPTSLEHEISTAFRDKYSYTPSYSWDYADFQDDWKNGRVPKLGG